MKTKSQKKKEKFPKKHKRSKTKNIKIFTANQNNEKTKLFDKKAKREKII